MFRKTHHTEIYLKSLSGLRFHIGELVFLVIFRSILLSESTTIISSIFYNSNIIITSKLRHTNLQKVYNSN
jgi:hypothetical protein